MAVVGPIAAVLALLGAALVALGVRGRRVDDHPICRGCGFDCQGVYPRRSVWCPECGCCLTPANTGVRRGRRERRSLVMLSGAGLLAMAAVLLLPPDLLSSTTFAPSRAVAFSSRTPLHTLIATAGRPAERVVRPALTELQRRWFHRGVFTGPRDQLVIVLDYALKWQARRSRPWLSEWDPFMQAALDAGLIEGERLERFQVGAHRLPTDMLGGSTIQYWGQTPGPPGDGRWWWAQAPGGEVHVLPPKGYIDVRTLWPDRP